MLGRRLVYSHHIIADEKRAAIRQEALDLQLGGCVKHGWPGIIVVEGAEADCVEYVRRIQRFRWQHLVVRGEQTVSGDPGSSIDDLRVLPRGFEELGAASDAMTRLAERCQEAGLDDLFMTSMKVYRSTGSSDETLAIHGRNTTERRK